MQRLRMVEQQGGHASGAKDRGMFKRGMKRGNIQIDSYESLSVEGKPVSFCRSQSA